MWLRSLPVLRGWHPKLASMAWKYMLGVSACSRSPVSGFRADRILVIWLTSNADGFLLSQFLSPSSNQRSDEFGGSPEHRAELLVRILRSIRAAVPRSFCVGVKINSADHMNSGGFEDMLRQMALIDTEKPDYVQLTGGSFEDPQVSLLPPHQRARNLMSL